MMVLATWVPRGLSRSEPTQLVLVQLADFNVQSARILLLSPFERDGLVKAGAQPDRDALFGEIIAPVSHKPGV